MSDEKNESRINIEDLPQAEQELTAEDARKVQGGAVTTLGTNTDTKKGGFNLKCNFEISG